MLQMIQMFQLILYENLIRHKANQRRTVWETILRVLPGFTTEACSAARHGRQSARTLDTIAIDVTPRPV